MYNVFGIACIVHHLGKWLPFENPNPLLSLLRMTVWAITVVLHGVHEGWRFHFQETLLSSKQSIIHSVPESSLGCLKQEWDAPQWVKDLLRFILSLSNSLCLVFIHIRSLTGACQGLASKSNSVMRSLSFSHTPNTVLCIVGWHAWQRYGPALE